MRQKASQSARGYMVTCQRMRGPRHIDTFSRIPSISGIPVCFVCAFLPSSLDIAENPGQ